jgi:fructosamine-3-kinase
MIVSEAVSHAVRKTFGAGVTVVGVHGVLGGCINRGRVLTLSDGGVCFLKENDVGLDGMFAAEKEGLERLAAVGMLRVPRPFVVGSDGGDQFLLMECIVSGSPKRDFWDELGTGLARHHRSSSHGPVSVRRYGLEGDNYIGSSPQVNEWSDDWAHFFGERRLRPQLDRAARSGLLDASIESAANRLIDRLGMLLPAHPAPALLHGDLWSGNFMVDDSGSPVLIDPAVFYGHNEADLAMTRLFGGFPRAFYDAYRRECPVEKGFDERCELYNLYHLLNHLNLFGTGYLGGVSRIIKRFQERR